MLKNKMKKEKQNIKTRTQRIYLKYAKKLERKKKKKTIQFL